MEKLKSLLRSFTLYQKCYLIAVLLLTAAFILFFPDLMLEETDSVFVLACSVVSVLANPVCELLISKQSRWNFIVSVIFVEIPEIILSFALGWYTLAVITLVFWMPIDIASFVKWTRHPDADEEELTVVKRLSWKQDALALIAIFAFGFGVGSVMTLIPGASDSYLDALTAAFGMANGILLLFKVQRAVVRVVHHAGAVRHPLCLLRQLHHAHHHRRHAGEHLLRLREVAEIYPDARRR